MRAEQNRMRAEQKSPFSTVFKAGCSVLAVSALKIVPRVVSRSVLGVCVAEAAV